MTNCAYSELYISLAQRVMGDMYDYAVNMLGYELSKFHNMFIVSGIAEQIEIGNPTYVAGKNGCEVAKAVIQKCTGYYPADEEIMNLDKSREYWVGWALAYYQWKRCVSFSSINEGVSIDEMCGMYPTLHEADISVFVEALDSRLADCRSESMLRRLRCYAGLSQAELATEAGVPLRQIQLFEQGQRDIRKTQGQTLQSLARVLKCDMEILIKPSMVVETLGCENPLH